MGSFGVSQNFAVGWSALLGHGAIFSVSGSFRLQIYYWLLHNGNYKDKI